MGISSGIYGNPPGRVTLECPLSFLVFCEPLRRAQSVAGLRFPFQPAPSVTDQIAPAPAPRHGSPRRRAALAWRGRDGLLSPVCSACAFRSRPASTAAPIAPCPRLGGGQALRGGY